MKYFLILVLFVTPLPSFPDDLRSLLQECIAASDSFSPPPKIFPKPATQEFKGILIDGDGDRLFKRGILMLLRFSHDSINGHYQFLSGSTKKRTVKGQLDLHDNIRLKEILGNRSIGYKFKGKLTDHSLIGTWVCCSYKKGFAFHLQRTDLTLQQRAGDSSPDSFEVTGTFILKDSFDHFASKRYVSEKRYDNGNLKKTQEFIVFADGDMLQDGPLILWYEDGRKQKSIEFKNGQRHGVFTLWYENGQKKLEASYKADKLDGVMVMWYPNGQRESESVYEDGKFMRAGQRWYKNGELESVTFRTARGCSTVYWDTLGKRITRPQTGTHGDHASGLSPTAFVVSSQNGKYQISVDIPTLHAVVRPTGIPTETLWTFTAPRANHTAVQDYMIILTDDGAHAVIWYDDSSESVFHKPPPKRAFKGGSWLTPEEEARIMPIRASPPFTFQDPEFDPDDREFTEEHILPVDASFVLIPRSTAKAKIDSVFAVTYPKLDLSYVRYSPELSKGKHWTFAYSPLSVGGEIYCHVHKANGTIKILEGF